MPFKDDEGASLLELPHRLGLSRQLSDIDYEKPVVLNPDLGYDENDYESQYGRGWLDMASPLNTVEEWFVDTVRKKVQKKRSGSKLDEMRIRTKKRNVSIKKKAPQSAGRAKYTQCMGELEGACPLVGQSFTKRFQ